MNKELENISKEYIRKAEEIYSFVLTLLGVSDRRELASYVHNRNDINFEINGKNYVIMPHGRGFFFTDGEDEIDWEYGDNCVCGIDCWMLGKFIKHYYPEVYSSLNNSDIQKEFEKAFEAKEIDKRYGLFYFKASGNSS